MMKFIIGIIFIFVSVLEVFIENEVFNISMVLLKLFIFECNGLNSQRCFRQQTR